MYDWSDIRHFLAVARTGSTQAAGRALRADPTTVARRVASLEDSLGVRLFDRRQSGYALTPAGESLVARAEQLQSAADALGEAAAAAARDVSGAVRLTAEEFFSAKVLPPSIRDLNETYPSIRIEIEASDMPLDLAAGEADIALRSIVAPVGKELVGRRVAWDQWAFYCSRAYAAAQAAPRNRRELREHALIAGGPPNIWRTYQEWLRANDMEDSVTTHANTVMGLLGAVRAGSGIAALPCLVAEFEDDLVRCLPPTSKPRGLWLLTTQRLLKAPRIRVVFDFLSDRLKRLSSEQEARLAGRDPGA